MNDFLKKSLNLLLRRQTNILSAAFIIMVTVIFSNILGFIKLRMLSSIFGASNDLGVYFASSRLPDLLFQVIIAGALSSAFIPVFSDFLVKNKKEEGYQFASTLLSLGLGIFFIISLMLFIFAEFFSHIVAPGFTHQQIGLMANLMRIVLVGEMLFIIASFLSAVLQSYNQFFIPGLAAALYNLGIIIGIGFLSPMVGIYAPAYGVVIGSLLFVLLQLPFVRKVSFAFHPSLFLKQKGIIEVFHLMWPRTLSLLVYYGGGMLTFTLISFLTNPGRNIVIFDFAQTLAFQPVGLFGVSIAQAAFPVLSREKDKLEEFKATFLTSFNQMLYLVLPISILFIILRIPLVRLLYGASPNFDWEATVLTGRTLAYLSISIFAQALTYLVSRGFWALHDAKTPLIISFFSTVIMLGLGCISIFVLHLGVISIAVVSSIGNLLNFVFLLLLLDIKVHGFKRKEVLISMAKIAAATLCTGFALYIPIKLLDRLVFDTTKTINLLMLTGISSLAGVTLYLFLTWLFTVEEASTFLLLFKRVGNWKEILTRSNETIDAAHIKQ